jgi:hypothetical protein
VWCPVKIYCCANHQHWRLRLDYCCCYWSAVVIVVAGAAVAVPRLGRAHFRNCGVGGSAHEHYGLSVGKLEMKKKYKKLDKIRFNCLVFRVSRKNKFMMSCLRVQAHYKKNVSLKLKNRTRISGFSTGVFIQKH